MQERELETLVTIDTIISWAMGLITDKKVVHPAVWVEIGIKINILMGELDAEICHLRACLADLVVLYLDMGKSASEAKLRANSGPHYEQYLRANAKREQCIEFIRLAKVRSKMALDEYERV